MFAMLLKLMIFVIDKSKSKVLGRYLVIIEWQQIGLEAWLCEVELFINVTLLCNSEKKCLVRFSFYEREHKQFLMKMLKDGLSQLEAAFLHPFDINQITCCINKYIC